MQLGDRLVNMVSGHSGVVVAIILAGGDEVTGIGPNDHDLIAAVVIEEDSGGFVDIQLDPGDLVSLDKVMH